MTSVIAQLTEPSVLKTQELYDEITVITRNNGRFSKAIGFLGLGRRLTLDDVGKKVIKPGPDFVFGRYDWGKVPNKPTEEEVKRNYCLVKKVDVSETTVLVDSIVTNLVNITYSDRPLHTDEVFENSNWATVQEYTLFLNHHYLPNPDRFINASDPDECTTM